jgi:hypothetical protein
MTMSINCLLSGLVRCWRTSSHPEPSSVVRLTEVSLQAAQSRIVVNAHRINQGLMPDFVAVEGSYLILLSPRTRN